MKTKSIKSLRAKYKDKKQFACEVDEIENGYVITDYSGDRCKKFYAETFDEMVEILTSLGYKR